MFAVVEKQPEFPGGPSTMMKYLSDNIKYPPSAVEEKIQGRVTCNFVIEKDGSITDVKAVRVIQSMPKWKPGTQHGQPVRVRFTLPVIFKIQN